MSKLTELEFKRAKPGTHEDGRGLRLVVANSGAKNWILRIQKDGRRREIGLGSASLIGLADARAKAEGVRTIIRDGLDPVAERRKGKTKVPTFREVAKMVHAEHLPSWKNPKHGKQWITTMEQYVFPKLGDVQVDKITAYMVREALLDIWLKIPETARRVRQRIGTVLDYAYSRDWRDQEAPMRSVSKGLPKQPKVQKHFPAMPWQDVSDFVTNMSDAIKATDTVLRAIEFTILTAARSGEVRLATWGEIDLDKATWTIPAERMKAGVEHRVPLSDRAVEILQEIGVGDKDILIFKGRKAGRPLSDMSLTMPLRRANLGITVHGFRSAFRDWCAEATNTPREVAESCLAHTVKDATERAYARTDYFDKRRVVMNQWGAYCSGVTIDNVVTLGKGTAS
ncbi:MAG: integrase arm-type DNA-binding domain-containing protein [Rhodospirillaceae bacterium]|nr:integrase arm-type DNA-binding domain-containing protein [Rhodospirillaceae bacterium]